MLSDMCILKICTVCIYIYLYDLCIYIHYMSMYVRSCHIIGHMYMYVMRWRSTHWALAAWSKIYNGGVRGGFSNVSAKVHDWKRHS